MSVASLEQLIAFFNQLHAREDHLHQELFVRSFNEWAKPALLYAFNRVDVEKSDKEIVSYVCKTFYTKFIELRAKSQGMSRMRRKGKWVYYKMEPVNEDTFRDRDVLHVIFHDDRADYPPLGVMAQKLTKRQTRLLVDLYEYVREDVRNLTTEEFYEKYPHKRMSYRRMAEEMDFSYDSFVKNIQRIRGRVRKM